MMKHARRKLWLILAALPLMGLGSCLLEGAGRYYPYVVEEFFFDVGYFEDDYYDDYYYYDDDYYDDYYDDDYYDWW